MNARFRPGAILWLWVALLARLVALEEQLPVAVSLKDTTLSGFVDTSATWLQESGLVEIPGSDSFATRSVLTNSIQLLTHQADGATAEKGEPEIAIGTARKSRWWTWVAPDRGTMALEFTSSNSPAAVAVFAGNDLSQLSLVTNNSVTIRKTCTAETGRRLKSFISWEVEAGQVFQIAMDFADPRVSFGTNQQGASVLQPIPAEGSSAPATTNSIQRALACFTAVPTNNSFSSRTILAGNSTVIWGSTFAARTQPGEPRITDSIEASLWYRWTAPSSGLVTISLNTIPLPSPPSSQTLQTNLPPARYDWPDGIKPGFELWLQPTNYVGGSATSPWGTGGSSGSSDSSVTTVNTGVTGLVACGEWQDVEQGVQARTTFAVYTGNSVTNLVRLTLGQPLSFRAEAGIEYVIQRAADTRAPMSGHLHLELIKPPNDSFADRSMIAGVAVSGSGFITGANPEPGDPENLGSSVWWTWTAPEAGMVRVDLATSDFVPQITIFEGESISGLRKISTALKSSENRNSNPVIHSMAAEWQAEAGRAYNLAMGSEGQSQGAFYFSLGLRRFAPAFVPGGIRPMSDGSVRLELNHLYGRKIELHSSADMQSWELMWRGRFNADEAVIRDFYTGIAPKFYRLFLVTEE